MTEMTRIAIEARKLVAVLLAIVGGCTTDDTVHGTDVDARWQADSTSQVDGGAADSSAADGWCQPTTCKEQGKNCGTIFDGCGGTLNCGDCTSPESCGGGGIANECGLPPPSCMGLALTCGPTGTEDCCESLLVEGGAFCRSSDSAYPATVNDFLLDRYEITVGRFRKFVEAGMGTQESPPMAGAGTHPLIAGSGWDPAWKANLPVDSAEFKTALNCDPSRQTWTDTAGANESLPMNCLNWYDIFAFCAWDGGRLPTEAEWNYAAAGGSEHRWYPWGNAAPDGTFAVYDCLGDGSEAGSCAFSDILVVGSRSPKGDGRWGQSDLAGSLFEWTLDWYADPYSMVQCSNCANMVPSTCRSIRGACYFSEADSLITSRRLEFFPPVRVNSGGGIGGRCARNAL
ncbi:MAG: SUMF1/EgtB/PvdO family nonheme iron enzyme [Pseudomonadota bacterium]